MKCRSNNPSKWYSGEEKEGRGPCNARRTRTWGYRQSHLPGGAHHVSSCVVLPAALASHDYILKIVPTVYEDKSGKQRYSYQYTVANKVSWP